MESKRIPKSKRISITLGGLFLLVPIVADSVWSSFNMLQYYISYPASFVFTPITFFLIFMPFILGPVIYLSLYSGVVGKKASLLQQKMILIIILTSCLIGLLATVTFHAYFAGTLSAKGYLKCQGIPTGYMPGMGKQYVKDLSLCH